MEQPLQADLSARLHPSIWLFRSNGVGKLCRRVLDWLETLLFLVKTRKTFFASREAMSRSSPHPVAGSVVPKRTSDANRGQIDSALRRVQSGEWSPLQAAIVLSDQLDHEDVGYEPIDRNAADRLPDESLDALIDRLGTPPTDVLLSWRFQLQVIARAFEFELDKPFPQLEPARVTIDAFGSLSCGEFRFAQRNASDSPRMHDSQRNLDLLLRSLAGGDQDLSLTHEQPQTPTTISEPEINVERSAATKIVARDSIRTSEPKRPAKSSLVRRRGIFAAVIFFAAVAIVVALYSNSSRRGGGRSDDRVEERASGSPVSADEFSANGPMASGSLADRSESTGDDAPSELQTLDLLGDGQGGISAGTDPLSLAELMPVRADFLPSSDVLEPASLRGADDDSPATASAVGSGESANIDAGDDFEPAGEGHPTGDAAGNENLPDESPQSTRLSKVTTIQLPAIPTDSTGNAETAVNLWETAASDLELDFPFDVPLAVEARDTGWSIRDKRNDVAVAAIRTGADGTRLQWTQSATDSPIATALTHGRLRSGEGQMVFLRPQIEADPWPLRLDQPDVRPTWDLRGPLPPRVSRVAIACELPRDVEVGWIQPLEETDIRRGRAMAVLTPTDGESVAIGMRLDIRGGRKVSCRIRFAARLDPAMQWQVISHSALLQFSNQLSEQAAVLSREKQRLAAVYERADTVGRRVLRLKQDRVAAQSDSLREVSSRIVELQSLISSLETGGTLRLRVWVEWPNETQPILEMTPPPP
jgi:hypothetical protein